MVKVAIFALVFLLCGYFVQAETERFIKGKFLPVKDLSENSSDLPSIWETIEDSLFLAFTSMRVQQQYYRMDPTNIKPPKPKVKK